jgi:pyruvate,water dikinase
MLEKKRGREKKKDLSAQIYSYAKLDDKSKSPIALYKAGEEKREKAYQQLLAHLEGKKKKKFEELYRVVECLGGLRESPKYNLILAIDKLRSHFLSLADSFDECPEKFTESDIFSLSLKQVLDYEHSQDFEGLEATVNKAKEKKRLLSQCKQVFPLIDSRGRFYRPKPPKAGPGEFVGQAISPGKVEGRIRVLSNPTEKPLEPGDILVAKATDPGWTPLFVNAAAIILEVGGPLQHGALVAREYGKPCVSGILSATDKLHDGEIVSVDGDSGIVTVLKKAA